MRTSKDYSHRRISARSARARVDRDDLPRARPAQRPRGARGERRAGGVHVIDQRDAAGHAVLAVNASRTLARRRARDSPRCGRRTAAARAAARRAGSSQRRGQTLGQQPRRVVAAQRLARAVGRHPGDARRRPGRSSTSVISAAAGLGQPAQAAVLERLDEAPGSAVVDQRPPLPSRTQPACRGSSRTPAPAARAAGRSVRSRGRPAAAARSGRPRQTSGPAAADGAPRRRQQVEQCVHRATLGGSGRTGSRTVSRSVERSGSMRAAISGPWASSSAPSLTGRKRDSAPVAGHAQEARVERRR